MVADLESCFRNAIRVPATKIFIKRFPYKDALVTTVFLDRQCDSIAEKAFILLVGKPLEQCNDNEGLNVGCCVKKPSRMRKIVFPEVIEILVSFRKLPF